jgi:hypothetical protein
MPRTYLRSRSGRTFFAGVALTCVCAVALLGTPAWSHDVEPHPHAEDSKAADQYKHPQHGSLGEIGLDRVLFETDHPHPICLYGDQVREKIDAAFAACHGKFGRESSSGTPPSSMAWTLPIGPRRAALRAPGSSALELRDHRALGVTG